MTDPTGQPALRIGAASYPPSYSASGAVLGRTYQRYIGARVRGDAGLAELMRNELDATLDRTQRLDALARMQLPAGGNCGESVRQAGQSTHPAPCGYPEVTPCICGAEDAP